MIDGVEDGRLAFAGGEEDMTRRCEGGGDLEFWAWAALAFG